MTKLVVLGGMAALRDEAEFRDGVMKCVRCSVCVPRCPSYTVFRNEGDSPRGRVQLMRAAIEGRVTPDRAFEQHMDRCLGCRACEDACPSEVPFGALIHRTHEVLRSSEYHRGRKRLLGVALAVLARATLLLWLARIGRVLQFLRLDRLLRWMVAPFSRRTARRLDQLPRVTGAPFNRSSVESAADPSVHFFSGCVMAATMGNIQRATVEVLRAGGEAVSVPRRQVCCGALHLHAGRREEAAALARINIEAFEGDTKPICINSAGCGLAMKEYGHLLADDPAWAARAAAFSSRVRDLEELARPHPIVTRPPLESGRPLKVAVQQACHHWNVQKIRGRGAALLEASGGVEVIPLPIGKGCCGSAGLFSAVQTDAAWQLLGDLLDRVEASGCDVVVSSNPGCLLFLRAGLEARGSRVTAHHLAEVLAGTVGPARTT